MGFVIIGILLIMIWRMNFYFQEMDRGVKTLVEYCNKLNERIIKLEGEE